MNILLASASAPYGGKYLEYLAEEIRILFKGINEIIFIPFARPGGLSHDEYTQKARNFFSGLNIKVKGLHEFENQTKALDKVEGYFTGGGNTFLLVKTLYENKLMDILKENVKNGKAYLGASAGSNIAGLNMKTTNDMPIVYPQSFETMGLVPFNLNPHFPDPKYNLNNHGGETRETRILEFLSQNNTKVIGLRDGNWIRRIGNEIKVIGEHNTLVFEQGKEPYELTPKSLL